MRVKAVISYDGTSFYGYQIQTKTHERTVQDEIQKVLKKIFSKEIIIQSSGRTDRGVHALGQVIHFDLDNENTDLGKLRWSLNGMIPSDIHFISLEKVADDFHARYSVTSKEYRYIVNKGEPNPLMDRFAYSYMRNFDEELLKKAMELFVGEHNFYNFCSNDDGSFVRTIESFTLTSKDNYLFFDIKGTGFRRYMVRMIVGTCLEASLGKITIPEIKKMLENTEKMNRTRFKAPANGLFLMKVNYDGGVTCDQD